MDDNPRSDGPDHPDVSTALLWLTAVRRWFVPVAAPALIALGIAAGVDYVNRTPPGPNREPGQPVSGPHQPPHQSPRYLVGIRRAGSAVVVSDVRSLATVAEVPAPRQRRFQQVAAAGPVAGGAGSYVVSGSAGGGIAFYRLQVAGDGRPGPLSPLPGLWIPGASPSWSDMAINERGDTIAYVSYRRAQKKIAIDVVATGGGPRSAASRRTWTTSHPGRIGGLSWSGRTLAFVWTPMRGKTVVRHQLRTLDTALPPGDLKISRPVLTLPVGADTAVLSRDGASVVTGVAGPSGLELAAYSAADGRRTKVIWRQPGAASPVVQLVPAAGVWDGASGDLIAETADGRLLVAPAHGGTGPVPADLVPADLGDVAWGT